MPILKSSKKALRSSARKAKFNNRIRKLYKQILKKTRKNPSLANLKKAYSLLDKAAKTNVIKKNKASRLKSRLAKLVTKKTPKQATTKKTAKRRKTKTAKKISTSA